MTMVSTGWLVLEITGSPLSLGIIWATRAAPHLLWGMLAGAVADKVNRRHMLLGIGFLLACASLLFGHLITNDVIQLWQIFMFIFVTSSLKTFDMTARQVMVVDVVGRDQVVRSIALNSVGLRMMGLIGGAVAGVLISVWNTASPFYLMSVCYGIGFVFLWMIHPEKTQNDKDTVRQASLWAHYREGFTIIRQNRVIAVLVAIAILCEVFGFSYQVLLPLFARDVLNVGAVGLGAFTAAQSLGGLIATLALTAGSQGHTKGRLLLILYCLFGATLLLFAQSSTYFFSLFIICLIGGVAATFDAIQHILLQLNVAEEQRGRAMGIWQLSIGFGPVGHVFLGFLAATMGPMLALTINGVLILSTFLVILRATNLRKI